MSPIKNLIQLQDIDSELMELNEILGDLPGKVDDLLQNEKNIIIKLEDDRERLKSIEVELKKAELDIEETNVNINRLKDQLFLVKNNKQYDALMMEIDHLKNQIDEFETKDLELMEEKSQLVESVKDQESNLETVSNDLVVKREKLETMLSESSDQKLTLEDKRKVMITAIEDRLLQKYERISKAREGTAVIALQSGACGGCGSAIPPQVVAEIKSGTKIHSCDVCGRFIYWKKSD